MRIKSDFIRLQKEKLGMSGTVLAEKAGVSRYALSTAIAGGSASAKMVLGIAKALGVEPEQLIREEE